jgi:EmrB/QacA subfamily drug resistance transporter
MLTMSSRRRWAVTAGVMTGMLLAALEATVVGTAMPTIVAQLGGLAHYSWVFSAYLLTSTVTVPIWGKLSDLFGRRLLYQAGIAVFLIGSAACGLSQTMMHLVFARAFQGIGAGALVPLAMTIIGDMFTLEERAKMQGLFSGIWGLSSIVGPLLGGFITDQLSWRWVFYINLPIGIAAAAIIGVALQEPPRTARPAIDYLGAALLTASVTMLMLVLVEGGTVAAIFTARNIVLLLAAASLFAWFVRVEMRAIDPVVPLTLFRNRVVTISIAVGFLAGIAMFGAITFVPLMAQGVLGATATQAGTFLTPLMLAWVAASIIGGRLLIRIGSRPLVIAGLLCLIVGFGALSMFKPTTPRPLLLAELSLIGLGLGLTMLTLLIAAQHAVRREQLGITTSLNQFSRTIGGALGVALLGALLVSGLSGNLHKAASQPGSSLTAAEADRLAENPNALVQPEARARIAPHVLTILQQAMASALRNIFLISAILLIVALLLALMIPGGRIETVAGTGEDFVMAELTTIDAEHEPCCE